MDIEDIETAREIIAKHVGHEMWTPTIVDGEKISIQFHDAPDEFGAVLTELLEKSYSFTVDGGWEVPPLLRIDSRDYYEPHGDEACPLAVQCSVESAKLAPLFRGECVDLRGVNIDGRECDVFLEVRD